MTLQHGSDSHAGRPARFIAGLAFLYALAVTVVLLAVTDFLAGEPDRRTVLAWLLVPLVSSFGAWTAVYSGFAPLRAWVWVGAAVSTFFCWIAIFSIGAYYLPVPLLMVTAALSPWTDAQPGGGDNGLSGD